MPDPEGVPGDGQGAAVSPPASPPAPPPPPDPSPPPPPPASPPEPPPPFYAEFDPELRGYTETKGFKDAKSAVEGYRNLEKLLGVPKEQILKLPADLKDGEAMKPIMERLGLAPPAESKGYEFGMIEGIDPARAPMLEGIIHKHGVPQSMANAVMKDIVAWEREALKQQEAAEVEEAAIDRGKFMAKHGAKAEEKIESARRFVRQLGMSQEVLERIETQMGLSDFWEFFSKAGEMMGESGFTDGTRKQTFDMSPEAAKAERARLMTDRDFMSKYTGGDLGAREKLSRLNQIMAQGGITG